MISLTKLNGQEFVLNVDLIKFVENVPDTLITLTTGEKVFVSEIKEEIILKVLEFKRMQRNIPQLVE